MESMFTLAVKMQARTGARLLVHLLAKALGADSWTPRAGDAPGALPLGRACDEPREARAPGGGCEPGAHCLDLLNTCWLMVVAWRVVVGAHGAWSGPGGGFGWLLTVDLIFIGKYFCYRFTVITRQPLQFNLPLCTGT